MVGRFAVFVVGFVVALAIVYLPDSGTVSGQTASAPTRFAAVPGEKGGQDIFGAYDVVADWPKDLSTIKGHEGWTFGAGQSVFAESPNRIFVLQRGELPALGRPKTISLPQLGPNLQFPIGRLPWRDATTASPPSNGGTGQPAEGGMEAWEKGAGGRKFGVDARWEHTVMIFDGQGNLVDSWNQDDSMMQRPHFVAISPYDSEKHVWIVDDHKHVVHKFTNDGKTKVMTIGTYGEPGADEKHFNRPTFMDWFPDGSFIVADGYNGTRVVKFDKDGKYLTAWGQKGEAGKETRPGYFNNVHGIAVDPKTRRVFVNDRGNKRAQVFDENGKFLYEWSFGRGSRRHPPLPHLQRRLPVGRRPRHEQDAEVRPRWQLQYAWGTWGDFPGGFWGVHGFSVDQEGNVYVAEVDNGGAQNFRPRKGANPAMMIGKPLRVAWK